MCANTVAELRNMHKGSNFSAVCALLCWFCGLAVIRLTIYTSYATLSRGIPLILAFSWYTHKPLGECV